MASPKQQLSYQINEVAVAQGNLPPLRAGARTIWSLLFHPTGPGLPATHGGRPSPENHNSKEEDPVVTLFYITLPVADKFLCYSAKD